MRKLYGQIVLFLSSVILAWMLTFYSSGFQKTYSTVTGNVCEITANNPLGYCYEELPKGGFPLIYVWDNPGVSVQGALSFVEDRVEVLPMWLNFGFYFGLIWSVILLIRYMKRRLNPSPLT